MQRITTFLWFDDQAEEAAKFYISLFKKSRITGVSGSNGKGKALVVSFRLEGQDFMALNGGPHFKFTPAISLFVDCQTQKEVDRLWKKLGEGGKDSQCGWLQDKYGLSWQIVPTILGKLLGDPDPAKAGRAMEAMMGMGKLDIAALKRAHSGRN
jgi:predicted 3-demethylubiquinone-9 3-methyltransferase (glyoxalase superfamily)